MSEILLYGDIETRNYALNFKTAELVIIVIAVLTRTDVTDSAIQNLRIKSDVLKLTTESWYSKFKSG